MSYTDTYVLNYEERLTLRDSDIKKMVEKMYKFRSSEDGVHMYLPKANRFFNKMCELQDGSRFDESYKQQDWLFIDRLIDQQYIEPRLLLDSDYDENGDFNPYCEGRWQITDREFVEYLYYWSQSPNYCLHSGLFSLNKITGEAYFKNNKTVFQTYRGKFKLLQAFLEKESHELTYWQILELTSKSKIKELDKIARDKVTDAIEALRNDLKIPNEDPNRLSASGDRYILITN